MLTWLVYGACALVTAYVGLAYLISSKIPSLKTKDAHVVITGGSSGIGLCVAIDCAKTGANITIIARNKTRLAAAQEKIKKFSKTGYVAAISSDTSSWTSINDAMEQAARDAPNKRIDAVIISAGVTYPKMMMDTPPEEISKLVNINFTGAVFAAKAAVPHMKHSGHARLVFVSSMAMIVGSPGYAVYTGTKTALRGVAESLMIELSPHNIATQVVIPPDVDTPMYEAEQKIKCEECKIMSEGYAIVQPEVVSARIMDGLKSWRFFVPVGNDATLASYGIAGLSPGSFAETVLQPILMPIVRLVGLSLDMPKMYQVVMTVHKKNKNKTD